MFIVLGVHFKHVQYLEKEYLSRITFNPVQKTFVPIITSYETIINFDPSFLHTRVLIVKYLQQIRRKRKQLLYMLLCELHSTQLRNFIKVIHLYKTLIINVSYD